MKKILTLSNIRRVLSERRFKSVVFFSGVFDLFHYGHFRALRDASRLGDILIVQIDGNKLVKKRKGDGRPYLEELHRAEIVSSLEFVDYVFISNTPSESESKLKSLSPNVFVRAIIPSESNNDRNKRTKNLIKKSPGTKIVWLEKTPEISTTKIISAVGGSKKQITIGIPAFNEEKNIKFLIESLQMQKLLSGVIKEIIVVSDGSTDSTVSILRSIKDSRLIAVDRKKRVGLNQTQNEIVKRAKGDILVMLDADILPKDNFFLEELITPLLKDRKIGIVGANTVSLPSRNILERVLANSHELKQFMYSRICEGNNVYMCHGRARTFSKELYTKITWPDNCPEDAYSYFFCVTNGFRFIFNKEVSVLFRSPSKLNGHIAQSNRFIHGKKMLEKYFEPEFVRKAYIIPKHLMFRTTLFFLFKNPLSTPLYMVLNAYIRLFKNHKPEHHSKYEVSPTSKKVIV